MYSPLSDSDSENESNKKDPRWDQRERKKSSNDRKSRRDLAPLRSVYSDKPHRSRYSPDRTRRHSSGSRRAEKERRHHGDRYWDRRDARKPRSPNRKYHKDSSRSHTPLKPQDFSFISEMLRNKKIQKQKSEENVSLDKVDQPQNSSKSELEEGEIPEEANEDESFTPPLNLLKALTTEMSDSINNNEVIKKSSPKPKKKSVLDLPMPPIDFTPKSKKRTNKARSTPVKKSSNFKIQQTQHFKDICNHLDVNKVVISPFETFPDSVQYPMPTAHRPRPRPIILNRPQPIQEFADRPFESFEIVEKIGEGTYGKVFKAIDLYTKETVAMKYVRMEKEYEGFPITGLREIKLLRQLQHPNVIQLREIVHRDDDKDKSEIGTYLVFEYMNHDLMGLLDNDAMIFDEVTIYRIIRQILDGMNYCHKKLILHRDMKCSNILLNNEGVVKLADFGLGRQCFSDRPYTNRVISLWYRPIELLLGDEKYGPAVDIWSLGCILGELFQRRAVFPFANEIDMINAIFHLCGTPTKNSWPEVKYLPGFKTLKPKRTCRLVRDTFSKLIPPLALDLFDKMLCLSPSNRITAEDALNSNWITFMDTKKHIGPLNLPAERDCHELNAKLRRKKKTSKSSVSVEQSTQE